MAIVATSKWPDTIALVVEFVQIIRLKRGGKQITCSVKSHARVFSTACSSAEDVKQRPIRFKVLDRPIPDACEDITSLKCNSGGLRRRERSTENGEGCD